MGAVDGLHSDYPSDRERADRQRGDEDDRKAHERVAGHKAFTLS